MSDTEITDLAHERGSDGQLLPVTKTVEVRGEGEAEIEVIPATSGQRREWRQRLEDEADELADETQADLFDEFLEYDPEDFGDAESWDDIRPALTDAIGNAIFSELFDTGEDDFEKALTEAMEDVTEGNSETMD
jgi:hypothetical protein